MKKKDSTEQKVILKLQTYLSQRPHSEYELICKLGKHFCLQDIEKALTFARKNNWLPSPDELSQQLVEELNHKKKGWLFIQTALKQRRLPLLKKDDNNELRKAWWWILKKYNKSHPLSHKMRQKIYRFLNNRGFEEMTIQKVIYEYQNKQRYS